MVLVAMYFSAYLLMWLVRTLVLQRVALRRKLCSTALPLPGAIVRPSPVPRCSVIALIIFSAPTNGASE